MIYKHGERMGDCLGLFCFYCSLVFYIWVALLIKQPRGEGTATRRLDDYSQLGPTRLVGYLSSHIQRALMG